MLFAARAGATGIAGATPLLAVGGGLAVGALPGLPALLAVDAVLGATGAGREGAAGADATGCWTAGGVEDTKSGAVWRDDCATPDWSWRTPKTATSAASDTPKPIAAMRILREVLWGPWAIADGAETAESCVDCATSMMAEVASGSCPESEVAAGAGRRPLPRSATTGARIAELLSIHFIRLARSNRTVCAASSTHSPIFDAATSGSASSSARAISRAVW